MIVTSRGNRYHSGTIQFSDESLKTTGITEISLIRSMDKSAVFSFEVVKQNSS